METRVHTKITRNENILNCLYQKPNAVFKLICFPWAGGGSVYFAKWGQLFNDSLEVHSVRLAGRETRSQELFASDIYQIVDEIVPALLPVVQDKAFAFFGHSLGSYIAFMTALSLKEKYKMEPLHFFVSSAYAPHSKSRYPIPELNTLSEEQVRHYLLNFGGTPKHLIDNQDVMSECIHILKADAAIVKNFLYQQEWIGYLLSVEGESREQRLAEFTIHFDTPSEALLSQDITCFFGSEDIVKDIKGWEDITSGKVDSYMLPGDHFYLLEPNNENFIKNYITKCLEVSLLACF